MPDKKVSQLDELAGSNVDTTNDILHIVDTSAIASKRVTVGGLLESINNLTSITNTSVDPATDLLLLYDSSANTVYKVTVQDLVSQLNATVNTYSSGWEAVTTGNEWSHKGNGATKIFTHGLNTTDLQISIYAAEDTNGTNAMLITPAFLFPQRFGAHQRFGAQAQFITPSKVTVQLAKHGYAV